MRPTSPGAHIALSALDDGILHGRLCTYVNATTRSFIVNRKDSFEIKNGSRDIVSNVALKGPRESVRERGGGTKGE